MSFEMQKVSGWVSEDRHFYGICLGIIMNYNDQLGDLRLKIQQLIKGGLSKSCIREHYPAPIYCCQCRYVSWGRY